MASIPSNISAAGKSVANTYKEYANGSPLAAYKTKNSRKHIWLKLVFEKNVFETAYKRVTDKLGDSVYKLDNFNDVDTGWSQDKYCVYLPLASDIPLSTFTNNYTELLGDIDATTRGLLQLGGHAAQKLANSGVVNSLAKGMLTGGVAGPAQEMLNSLGGFVASLGGVLDSTKLWDKTTTPDIAFGGDIGLVSENHYIYYKMVSYILQAMTMPGANDIAAKKVTDLKNKFLDALGSQPNDIFMKWQAYTHQEPANKCAARVVIGTEDTPWIAGFNIVARETMTLHQDMLFAVNNCHLASLKWSNGTKEGYGFGDDGSCRTMSYELTLIPDNMSSVLDGIETVWQNSVLPHLEKNFAIDSRENGKVEDLTRNIMYYALNAGLIASVPRSLVANAYNNTVGVTLMLANQVNQTARVALNL